MPLLRTEAIILRTSKFSETSKIISAFTKENGRVGVLVKGGRKGSKKFPGGLETLNLVDLQFYYRSGRDLQNFKLTDLIEAFPTLRKDLQATYTALSLAETIERSTPPEDPQPDLFGVLADSLLALDQGLPHPWTIRWRALLHICRALGFGLSLQGCRRCSSKKPMKGFTLAAGGFICEQCYSTPAGDAPVSGEIWGVLRFLEGCPAAIAPRFIVTPDIGRKIEGLFFNYFRFHIPNFRSFPSWRALPRAYWGDLSASSLEQRDGR